MSRQVPERWVNAVITLTAPLSISPKASAALKLEAALAYHEQNFDPPDDCVCTIGFEDAEG